MTNCVWNGDVMRLNAEIPLKDYSARTKENCMWQSMCHSATIYESDAMKEDLLCE